MRHKQAFSLVEMLAAVTIFSMLALMGVPYAQSSKDRELEMSLRDTLTRIRWAITCYAWNEDESNVATDDNDSDGLCGEDPVGDPDADGISDDDRDGYVDEDGPPNYPSAIYDLVSHGYLSNVPRDPMSTNPTLSATDTWNYIHIIRDFPVGPNQTGIIDIRSGSYGTGLDGTRFSNW